MEPQMPEYESGSGSAAAQPKPGKLSNCGAAFDDPQTTKLAPKKQAAIADLQREFIAECLRIAALKATHAADDIEIGDDACAGRSIRIAILNMREAATGFRQLEALAAAIEAVGRALTKDHDGGPATLLGTALDKITAAP
jgi:hypothetical protein